MTWTLDTETGELSDHTGTVRQTFEKDRVFGSDIQEAMMTRGQELIAEAESAASNGDDPVPAIVEYMHVLLDGAFRDFEFQ